MAKAPGKPRQDGSNCILRRSSALDFARDEMTDHFGVGLALELATFRDQLVAERLEILDDAVVDERNRPDDVRMRIADRGRSVRRPARVRNADAAVQRLRLQLPREVVELALRPPADKLAIVDRANTSGIVSAIFEALQPVEQPLSDVRFPDNSYNPAHTLTRQPFSSFVHGNGEPNRRCPFVRSALGRGCRLRRRA